jgi:hypothetical protein
MNRFLQGKPCHEGIPSRKAMARRDSFKESFGTQGFLQGKLWHDGIHSRKALGQLAFCDPLKTWVVLGARDGARDGASTWQQERSRVAMKQWQSADRTLLIRELQAHGICVVSGPTASLLQQKA